MMLGGLAKIALPVPKGMIVQQEHVKKRLWFAVSITATLSLVVVAVGLCWTVYASVRGDLFESTVSSTLDTLDVIRDLGVESVDTQLRSVKTDVKALAAECGSELAAAASEIDSFDASASVVTTLSKLDLSPGGKDFWFFASDERLIGADGSSPSWPSVMPQIDTTDLLAATSPQVIGPAYNDEGLYVMAVCSPLVKDGETYGMLVERFDGYCVSDWISSLRFDLGGGTAYLVDDTGRDIAVSREENYEWFETEYNASELAIQGDDEAAGIAAIEQRALRGETARGSYGWGDGTSYMSYGPINEADWAIFVGFYGDELENHVSEVVSRSGGVAQVSIALLVLLLGMVALLSVRSLNRQRMANDRLQDQNRKIEQQAEALMASEARFKVALEKTGNIVFDYDVASGDIQCFTTPEDAQRCNATAANLRTELVSAGEVEESSLELFCDALKDLCHGAHRVECMLEVLGESGEKLWYRASLSALASTEGNPLRIIGVLEDVTKEREAEYDSLTGLLDRKAAFEAARSSLDEAGESDRFAFVMIDVDHFKSINDTFGHLSGDEALQWVANVLATEFDEADVVARYGGDEFCVFCKTDVTEDRLTAAMQRVNDSLRVDRLQSNDVGTLSCSFGVSLRAGIGLSFERLQTEADQALYAAKRKGRCTFVFYTES